MARNDARNAETADRVGTAVRRAPAEAKWHETHDGARRRPDRSRLRIHSCLALRVAGPTGNEQCEFVHTMVASARCSIAFYRDVLGMQLLRVPARRILPMIQVEQRPAPFAAAVPFRALHASRAIRVSSATATSPSNRRGAESSSPTTTGVVERALRSSKHVSAVSSRRHGDRCDGAPRGALAPDRWRARGSARVRRRRMRILAATRSAGERRAPVATSPGRPACRRGCSDVPSSHP